MPDDEQIILEGQILEATRDGSKREVVIDLIREGFGNARDGHYYGAGLLEGAAQQFANAKMYVNHIDAETQRKLQGLPRPVEHLGGRIVETAFLAPGADRSDEGWGINEGDKAVIRGRAKIAQPWLWHMIESDPELLGVSIHAGGRSNDGQMEGRRAKIVEAISNVRSVDWVTEAGAGGKVFALVEAQVEAELEHEDEDEVEEVDADLVECGCGHKGKPGEKCKGCGKKIEEAVEADADIAECGDKVHAGHKKKGHKACPDCKADLTEADEVVEAFDLADALTVLSYLDYETALEGALAGSSLTPTDDTGADTDPALLEAWDRLTDLAEADPDAAAELLLEAAEDEEEPDEGEQDDDLDPEDGDDEEVEADVHEFTDEQIEARALELAEERLEAAVATAVSTLEEQYKADLAAAQEGFDAQLAEAQTDFEKRLAQKDQRILAAQIIEGAGFKPATTKALKEQFHDAFFEATTDEQGEVTESGDDVLRKAVGDAIEAKKRELSDYVEARVTGVGESQSMREAGGTPGERPKKAPLDSEIDNIIGITPPATPAA